MQPAFLNQLQVRLADSTWSETTWELVAPLKYRTMIFDEPEIIEVPSGFETDFASIPRLPLFWWLAKGVMIRPSVIHDWLYTTGDYERETCDMILLEAGRVVETPLLLRGGMYATVRMFGGGRFGK